jgi:hypothetical protein
MKTHLFLSLLLSTALIACSDGGGTFGDTSGSGVYGQVSFTNSAVSAGFNPCELTHFTGSTPQDDSFHYQCIGSSDSGALIESFHVSFYKGKPDVSYSYIKSRSTAPILTSYSYSNNPASGVSLDAAARTISFNNTSLDLSTATPSSPPSRTMVVNGVLKY